MLFVKSIQKTRGQIEKPACNIPSVRCSFNLIQLSQQLVTMLYRYAGSPKANGSLDNFSDASTVSSYAVNAMQWAVANGIVNGSNGKLNPQNNATRAEVAAILMRFCEMSK